MGTMNHLLKAPGFQKRVLPLSVAAWHNMIRDNLAPARAELIRGTIIEKMSKSILHTKLSDRLLDHFKFALRDTHWTRKEAPLTLQDSEPEPDISVVSGSEADYPQHPRTAVLVVEVSVSTLAEDRALADLYAENGVTEFWIVNAPGRCIEVYRQPVAGHYTAMSTYIEGQTVTCADLSAAVEVSALFAGL
jgi:Uma2 family endonuclease